MPEGSPSAATPYQNGAGAGEGGSFGRITTDRRRGDRARPARRRAGGRRRSRATTAGGRAGELAHAARLPGRLGRSRRSCARPEHLPRSRRSRCRSSSTSRRAHGPTFLLVWEESDTTSFGRLVGLLPIARAHHARATAWRAHSRIRKSCLGQPLARPRPPPATPGRRCSPGSAPVMDGSRCGLGRVPRDGLFFRDVVAPTLGTTTRLLGEHRRACLVARDTHAANGRSPACDPPSGARRCAASAAAWPTAASGSTSARPRRPRSAARRSASWRSNANGWKGGRGSALLEDPGTGDLHAQHDPADGRGGQVPHRLARGSAAGAVAMGNVITANGRAHFWKTAFDETFAPLSPGRAAGTRDHRNATRRRRP